MQSFARDIGVWNIMFSLFTPEEETLSLRREIESLEFLILYHVFQLEQQRAM